MYTLAEATLFGSAHPKYFFTKTSWIEIIRNFPPLVVYLRLSALQHLDVEVGFCSGPDTRAVVSCGTPSPPLNSIAIVDIESGKEVVWLYFHFLTVVV